MACNESAMSNFTTIKDSSINKLHLFYISVIVLLLLGVVLSPGCKRRHRTKFSQQQSAEDYGRLPGLKESPLAALQDELARVVEQQGTPEQLDAAAAGDSKQESISDDENAASGLADVFPKETLKSLSETLDKQYPRDRFQFNALQLRTATGFLERHRREFLQTRQALNRPRCDFGFRYLRGFANDVTFIDRVRLSARLEGLAAAQSLFLDNDPAAAFDAVKNMFRWAALLAAGKNLSARLQAAQLRAEAIEVVQAIVQHPGCRREQVEKLHTLVQETLSAWPPDAGVWIGDRALGMHCYEIIRAGNIVSLLTEEEVEEFTAGGSMGELPKAAASVADIDELFYLGAMREIIEGCSLPYYKRGESAAKILATAAAKADAPDYPLAAARLLLPDIGRGLRMQAADRARVEALASGLDAALERPMAFQTNPLNGKKYQIGRKNGEITVMRPDGETADEPWLIIPVRKESATDAHGSTQDAE